MLKNEIFNEDCIQTMQSMNAETVDLIVTSPPYDNLRDYEGYNFDFEKTAFELYRVLKKNGVMVWVVADAVFSGSETLTSFKQALFFKELGFNMHDTMIFEKTSYAKPDKTRYWQNFEYMFVFSKGKPKTINLICDRKNITAGSVKFASVREKKWINYFKGKAHY